MELRKPDVVMRLDRMGSAFPTRLSFMRLLLRRMHREKWQFRIERFDLDDDGFGTAVLSTTTPERTYSLIVFSHYLPPEKRTDRVIAEAWDATFNLFDGIPTDDDIRRLSQNTPKQEGGRYHASELVLARANKSVRLFQHVVERLAEGLQPDIDLVTSVGYLMRTTAVYGNGKFGIADRGVIAGRAETMGAFQAEMLAVYLFRWFTFELVQHVARRRGGDRAVELSPKLAGYLGIGNATGLGMAPFLVRHPKLIDQWVQARETALARVLAVENTDAQTAIAFQQGLTRATEHVSEWRVDDALQMARIRQLAQDVKSLKRCADAVLPETGRPWHTLYAYAQAHCSLEGQELLVSLMLEPHGDLVDDLSEQMYADETFAVDSSATCGDLLGMIRRNYDWTQDIDFTDQSESRKFWYYSEDKLEPRIGDRYAEHGAELEMPLAIARDVRALAEDLKAQPANSLLADFLLTHPQHRQMVGRVQLNARHPYSEIRDNLIAERVRPIDILRFKLAFFGACRFDPKSDLWTRISMYQGAPLPHAINAETIEGWSLSRGPALA